MDVSIDTMCLYKYKYLKLFLLLICLEVTLLFIIPFWYLKKTNHNVVQAKGVT